MDAFDSDYTQYDKDHNFYKGGFDYRKSFAAGRISRYNPTIMRYERSVNSFLCIGVRGFDVQGLPGIAPVA